VTADDGGLVAPEGVDQTAAGTGAAGRHGESLRQRPVPTAPAADQAPGPDPGPQHLAVPEAPEPSGQTIAAGEG